MAKCTISTIWKKKAHRTNSLVSESSFAQLNIAPSRYILASTYIYYRYYEIENQRKERIEKQSAVIAENYSGAYDTSGFRIMVLLFPH
jgi:hypothetical protein